MGCALVTMIFVGGVIHPIFVNHLIGEVGFPSAIRYTALLLGICLVPVCLFVRGRLPRKNWDPNTVFLDRMLFRQPSFSLYTFGCFFVLYGLLKSTLRWPMNHETDARFIDGVFLRDSTISLA